MFDIFAYDLIDNDIWALVAVDMQMAKGWELDEV